MATAGAPKALDDLHAILKDATKVKVAGTLNMSQLPILLLNGNLWNIQELIVRILIRLAYNLHHHDSPVPHSAVDGVFRGKYMVRSSSRDYSSSL